MNRSIIAPTREKNSLVIFTAAARMLAEADTIQKARELKNLALTASDWARRKGMGEQAIQHCRSYALDAERKMGEMLAPIVPGRPKKKIIVGHDNYPTLTELGLSLDESSRAKRLFALPQKDFEAIKAGEKTRTQVDREVRRAAIVATIPDKPTGKYRVIYADPPWKYGDQLTENYGATRFHYSSLSIADLCALPIRDLAEDNAVLFLWVTSPLLSECWPVIKAWGFEYKSSFIWDKVKHNMGHYNSVRHEFLLVATRGSCTPDIPKLFDSVHSIERAGHSEKPEKFREIIDTLYPNGARIELFARRECKGWKTWGTHERD